MALRNQGNCGLLECIQLDRQRCAVKTLHHPLSGKSINNYNEGSNRSKHRPLTSGPSGPRASSSLLYRTALSIRSSWR